MLNKETNIDVQKERKMLHKATLFVLFGQNCLSHIDNTSAILLLAKPMWLVSRKKQPTVAESTTHAGREKKKHSFCLVTETALNLRLFIFRLLSLL